MANLDNLHLSDVQLDKVTGFTDCTTKNAYFIFLID